MGDPRVEQRGPYLRRLPETVVVGVHGFEPRTLSV